MPLHVPAGQHLEMDERQLPTGRVREVAATPLDFRSAHRVGRLHMDACFTGFTREGGIARVKAAETTLWMDSAFTHLMVFTGDTLTPRRRRRGLAVEPMTCPPDAFNSGKDLVILQPREPFVARWGLSP
jgi:aldose 1-epimerase